MSFRYDMDRRGVAEILKSPAVKSWLDRETKKKTAEANAICARNFPKGATGEDYAGEVRDLTFTSVGSIYPDTPLGKLDRSKNHTLDAINH